MSSARWDQAVKEHEAILEALDRRDGPALGHLLEEHLRNKCETVKESFLMEDAGAFEGARETVDGTRRPA
jgi:DNA-binding GntR family transcriptional regulator